MYSNRLKYFGVGLGERNYCLFVYILLKYLVNISEYKIMKY